MPGVWRRPTVFDHSRLSRGDLCTTKARIWSIHSLCADVRQRKQGQEGCTYLNSEGRLSDSSITDDDELVESAHSGCVLRARVDADARGKKMRGWLLETNSVGTEWEKGATRPVSGPLFSFEAPNRAPKIETKKKEVGKKRLEDSSQRNPMRILPPPTLKNQTPSHCTSTHFSKVLKQ